MGINNIGVFRAATQITFLRLSMNYFGYLALHSVANQRGEVEFFQRNFSSENMFLGLALV